MPAITLGYDATTQAFTALSCKGFAATEGHRRVKSEIYEALDGHLAKKQAVGFRRIFTLDLGIITDVDVLHFVGLFLVSNACYISTYTYDGITETNVDVVPLGGTEFESVWKDGVEIGRSVVLRLEEANPRTSYPA